jgi:large subunit ribosomal protein L22
MIRGVPVNTAITTLNFTNTKAAKIVGKTLKSALANAKQREVENLDELFVKEVFVNEGPIMRRFIARAMGRATRIRKRTSHITIVLSDGMQEAARAHHAAPQAAAHEVKEGAKEKHKDLSKKQAVRPTAKDSKIKSKAMEKFVRMKDQKKIGTHEKKGM